MQCNSSVLTSTAAHKDKATVCAIASHHVTVADKIKLEAIYAEVIKHVNEAPTQNSVLAQFISLRIKQELPRIAECILQLHNTQHNPALLLSGLPTAIHDERHIAACELMSLSFAYILGEPFQYLQQNDARLVARVTPIEGFENTQSGSSRGNFGWHTDDRIFDRDFRTQWIQLMGIHNPGHSHTLIAPIDEIIQRLPQNILKILMEERFEVKMPTSFGFKKQIWSQPISIISINTMNEYEVGVPTYHVRPINHLDNATQDALNVFINTIESCRYEVTLSSDNLLIFNNNRVLHGRSPIPGDRLILRTYVRSDLNALQSVSSSNGNIFDARLLL
jgi:hypothetical protein